MRKIVLMVVSAVVFTFAAYSQKENTEVKWYSFEEAVELNKTKPKKIFIDVYTDWCSWCKVMDQKTFSHPEIASYLNQYFYPVKFNAESKAPITFQGIVFENSGQGRRSPHELAAALLQGKMSYPSVAYLDEENRLLTSVPGYYPPDKMEPILKFFGGNHYKTTTWDKFSETFKGTIQATE